MRYFLAVLFLAITLGLVWFLDGIRIQAMPLAAGRLLDPFHGFWQNMEGEEPTWSTELKLKGLKEEVRVHFDERRVPHIFAHNDHDLYFTQGYVTARDRLWQMEFQILAASGRLSEILDLPPVLQMDRFRRRTGIMAAAEAAVATSEKDPMAKATFDAYTAGVNAYINSLSYKRFPLEYKLLDYAPEPWTNLKTCLLLKFMAWDLTGNTEDFEQTNAVTALGKDAYDRLFNLFPDSVYPIIPRGTPWEAIAAVKLDTPSTFAPQAIVAKLQYPQPDPHNGSNNWAVAGSKTASGHPILCNDPHLGLRLPSLWYEVQLSTPDHSVYGVSLPGAPCVIIGFNKDVAWGVTNASRDVQDWYKIEFQDASRKAYRYGDGWRPIQRRAEEIKVRGKAPFMDTVLYTHHGPIVYDTSFADMDSLAPFDIAMRWAGADSSAEIMTFYHLNRARNHAEYREALRTFYCPGQNFIFISREGDIAITQNGRFPAKWPGQGEFIMDGSDPIQDWQAYIPMEANPHIKNPSQGFIFSSNQVPTDPSYPFNVAGNYDYSRNRRIQTILARGTQLKVEDLQRLQNDNFNVRASEVLPQMLALVNQSSLQENAKALLPILKDWNYLNEPDLEAPSIYDYWEEQLVAAVWDDESEAAQKTLARPGTYLLMHWVLDTTGFPYLDDKRTPANETLPDILATSLNAAADRLDAWSEEHPGRPRTWQYINNVSVMHLARLAPFSHQAIEVGGNGGIVNANRKFNGASWRMVVELGDTVNAWGVYPGGASGNPGSPYFDNGIPLWAKGEYYRLHYMPSADKPNAPVKFSQTLQPE